MTFKKLAIFVEGQTEKVFVERLIAEIAGAKNVFFETKNFSNHRMANLRQVPAAPNGERFFVLIFDCQNDEQVKSVIKERRETLESAGYALVIGLLDLYPHSLGDVAAVRQRLTCGMPTKGVPTHIVLAIAEVEAWFLQESTHYANIDPALDVSQFKGLFGFDPTVDSAEAIEHPSKLLKDIYSTVKKTYKKKFAYAKRTVDALDVDRLCLNGALLIPSFQELLGHIDGFLSD